MKILVCGTLVPSRYETLIKDLSNAGNRFLMNFCSNLKVHEQIKVLSYVGVPVDENVKKELEQEDSCSDNIKYICRSRKLIGGLFKYMRELVKEVKNSDVVVTYNVVYAWFLAPSLSKMFKKKSVLILADYSPSASYSSLFRKMYASIQLKLIRKYDFVIGLSKTTENYLQKTQKFLCIEGGIDKSFYDYYREEIKQQRDKIRIMYAGILEKVTGIDMLLCAFQKLENSKIELYISGKGSLEWLVREGEEKDSRIHYLGCTTYEEYKENLSKADILVNPRNMNLIENNNNFPSKIMEYLATGKIILSTRFIGWENFKENIVFCESSIVDIQEQLARVVEQSAEWNREINRRAAERYIWEEQIKKIVKLIC